MATITTLTSLPVSADFTVTPARAEASDEIYGDNPNDSTGVPATAGSLVQSAPCPQHSLSERHTSRFGAADSLRASLSGTFFQTLPELVTPLKRHSVSGQLSTDAVSSLPKVGVLYNEQDRGSNMASKHAHKLEARPPV